jgi:hypothetical protein
VKGVRENYFVAAELGYIDSMINFGTFLDKSDPQRFVWLGKAAVSGSSEPFLNEMEEQIRNLNSRSGYASVVFVIVRAMKGHIDNKKREIFLNSYKFDSRIGPANRAIQFYNFQL